MNRRPKLTLLGHSASPDEAAAVIAAIEQFLRDTTPPLAPVADREPGWVAAARLEAVGRESDAPYPWS
jgi:hypothetical protein